MDLKFDVLLSSSPQKKVFLLVLSGAVKMNCHHLDLSPGKTFPTPMLLRGSCMNKIPPLNGQSLQ